MQKTKELERECRIGMAQETDFGKCIVPADLNSAVSFSLVNVLRQSKMEMHL